MTRLNTTAFVVISIIMVLTTMLYGAVHPPVIELFYLLVITMMILWAVDGFWAGNIAFSDNWLQLPLLGLGIYGLVQIIPFGTYASGGVSEVPRTVSIFPYATEVNAVHIFILFGFLFVALSVLQTASRLRRIAAFITIFGALYAFYAILQSVLSPTRIYGIYETGYAMPFGSFVNRHHFAAFIEMTAAIPLGMLFAGAVRRDKRLLYIIAVVLMGSALLLSGSRGGLVAMLCEVILIVILTTGGRREGKDFGLKLVLSVLLILAIVGGAIFVGGDTGLTRFAESAASQDITSNRTHIWAVTMRVIMSNLPFGTGLGAYPQAFAQHDTLSGLELVEQAHNDYLQILADAGIVGLILGGAFLFLFVRQGIDVSRRHNTFRRAVGVGAFAGCAAVLIHSLFDFVLHTTAISVMFLTLMAIMVAAGRQYTDDAKEFDEPYRRRTRSGSVTPMRSRTA